MFTRLKRHPRRKVAAGTVVAIVAALAVAGAALAYYGGSGSGSASANAGYAPRAVLVTGNVGSDLYPGATEPVNIEVSLAGNGNVRVGAVALDTTQGDNGIGGLPAGCLRSWFDFTPPLSTEFPAGANVSQASPLTVHGSLEFVDSGTLQDVCSNAALEVFLTASPN